ncbi:hypothetical protein N7486_007630 [Penicillium sp. IBT 16267x]|nr:hypothetical protein N7486_007630 [Penicillium sp. IBT 16267x]
MDDFNLSDIEFGDLNTDSTDRRIGQKSIDAIIASATKDRIASKRALKSLQFGKGAPGAPEHQQPWVQRFKAFREHSLKNDPIVPFTGKAILSIKTILKVYSVVIEYGVFI